MTARRILGLDIDDAIAGHEVGNASADVSARTETLATTASPTKGSYPEHALVAWAARRVGRPVKWTGTRLETFLTDYQSRDERGTP